MSLLKPSSCTGCSLYEPPYGRKDGYVPAHGSGDNGVLIVLEAAGADEAALGIPVVGSTGQYLFSQLQRIGIEREGFRIHNVLSCQPPNNLLLKQPYTEAAIIHCSPNLDKTIFDHVAHCAAIKKTPVIWGLGKYAARRIMGWTDTHPIMKEDYHTYPFWSKKYTCWVIHSFHPSYIMQGSHHLVHVLLFAAQRALSIAQEGLDIEEPPYLLDPELHEFDEWVARFLSELKRNPQETFLSYDIETPYKVGKGEDEIGKEESDDSTILRCSFCWKPGHAVSVRWSPEYMPGIERLFTSRASGLGWNNELYDNARILQYIPGFNLISLDGMLAWHMLYSSLPKSLGFVTPFYWDTTIWKHLAHEQPAYYNCKDSDAALRNWLGIQRGLKEQKLYPVFERHVMKLNEVLRYMTGKGIPLDLEARKAAEDRLAILLDKASQEMDAAVPFAARGLKIYKKTPKFLEGLVQVDGTTKTKQCSRCGNRDVTANHFKSVGKKRCKRGEPENPCVGASSEKVDRAAKLWAKPLTFKLSIPGLTRYQQVMKHKAIFSRKEKRITFDEAAIKKLRFKYPEDLLYATILGFRELQTLLSRYVGRTQEDGTIIGGMRPGPDGRIRTTYTHNPSTLRLASQRPNCQNLPRAGKKDSLQGLIRNLIVPSRGWMLGSRDFAGIEAVLVGYEAKDKDYIRLALRDVHSFYTAYALYEVEKRLSAQDLPILSWSDDKLFGRLAEIKQAFKDERNSLYKHLLHAANFGQGAYGARNKIYEETGIIYDPKLISRLMALYHELFPKIPVWQRDIRLQAYQDGFLRNAFGYIHRFNHVFTFTRDRDGAYERKLGDDAEAVLAFRPQSNAAGILKEAMLRLYFDRFDDAGQFMRLTTHDDLLWECPPEVFDDVDAVFQEEMEKPVTQLPLPDSYELGTHLALLSEGKRGFSWAHME